MNTDLVNSGARLLSIAIDMMAFSIALACAWACSSALMAIIVFILMALVMYIIATIIKLVAVMKLSPESLERMGRIYDRIAAIPASLRERSSSKSAAPAATAA